MLKISCAVIKYARNPRPFRFGAFSSSATLAEEKNAPNTQVVDGRKGSSNNTMIAAAFASLQSEDIEKDVIKTPQTDEKIIKANTVDELLSISDGSGISRRHALKVVSVLSQWSSSGKVNLIDFENDLRFIKLCRILTKNSFKANNRHVPRSDDLSTILNITADDEAAKLVATITLPQMVKVMSTLAMKKRRSTLLLRSLSYNITASSEQLDVKQCADLLYSITCLNFPEANLLSKICNDICIAIKSEIKKSSVVGSIITSMGLLKFKNSDVLDALSDWFLKNHKMCRPQDVFALFVSLAALNFKPLNSDELFKTLVPTLTLSEARKAVEWLDLIWSLVTLNQATPQHISTVLEENFLNKIEGNKKLSVSTKLKYLNIDGASRFLINNYEGPRLPQSSALRAITLGRSAGKTEMVEGLVAALRSLIQNENHLKVNVNTGLGFFIDAKIVMDKKCNPLPVNDENEDNPNAIKVAVMAYDYHDMCVGEIEPNGVAALAAQLLEAQGYKVLGVPYTDFAVKDKLVHRVQYLESKLKEVVK